MEVWSLVDRLHSSGWLYTHGHKDSTNLMQLEIRKNEQMT